MSCCPAAPVITIGGSGDEDFFTQDTNMRRGESVECYMKRAGNDTGRMDDKTEDIPNKIRNTDVPMQANGSVSVQFRLTPNSDRTASSWKMYVDDNVVTSIGVNNTVTLSGDTLSGTFAAGDMGKPFKIKISALDGAGEIDQRAFNFSPSLANGSDEIRFILPLPGAIVTSPFGPRRPPTTGASSSHGGADFAIPGGKVADVIAAADGEVIFTGFQNGGAGNYVKIKHLNGSGKHLCTTVYMHLDKIYVQVGQKMSAGQKVGLEGNTGVGTGKHLHFECRLPNDTKVNPVPYIKGTTGVAQQTNPDNTAVPGTVEPTPGNAVLTPANVDAKQNGCEPFGPDYPKDPTETTDPVPTSAPTDPFERAWFFTMKHEVGPAWTTSSPADPEISAGLIDTTTQRKKDGYVNTPNFPGGETKFGIAQGPNPSIKVATMPYDPAKQAGYNNYWKRGPSAMVATKPKTAIMLFDLNYLHGVGNANKIVSNANLGSKSDDDSVVALSAAQQAFMQNIVAQNPQRQKYLAGWLKRSRDLLVYVQSLA